MHSQLAIVKNVINLQNAHDALESRAPGIPGMGLVYGFTGAGKTTAIAWLVTQCNGVYVRAGATWTPTSMLGSIMKELGADPLGRAAPMVDFIVNELAVNRRSLFLDEADYLTGNLKMLETMRDIHDLSQTPVMLIGMEGIDQKLIHRKQLSRRISHWVKFLPADLDDAAILAETTCEVQIEDDLLAYLHKESKGSIGLMTIGLSRIEAFAKAQELTTIDLATWGKRQLFLSHPKLRRR